MQSLIDRDYEQEDVTARKIADIVVPNKEIEVNVKEVKPEKVEDPEEPPPELQPLEFDMDMDVDVVNLAPSTQVNVYRRQLNAAGCQLLATHARRHPATATTVERHAA